MVNQLLLAVTERRIISFRYGGYVRIGEPHVLGEYRGSVQLLFYQTGGQSASNKLPEWRRFNVDGISSLRLEEQHFPTGRSSPGAQHSKWDKQYAFVP